MTAWRRASGLFLSLLLLAEIGGGFFAFPHKAEAASFSNLSHGSDITDLSTYTFSSVALGAGSASRIVVVGFSWRDTAANSMLSATIGGAPMTKIVEQQHDDTGNGSYTNNSLWVARVPSGTSADIVLSLSDVAIRAAYTVGTLPSGSLVPYDTATATGVATLNSTIDVPENGTVFALAGVGHTTYTSAAWTGATEFVDTSFEASAYTAATLSNATLEAARAVNTAFTLTGGVDGALVAASFSPQASLARPANNLGLVGYWSFNEATSTTATDFSGRGNDGTLNTFANPPTSSSGWSASGKRGGALAFDDSSDYVSLPANSSLYASDGTVAFWMKSTTDALGTPFSATLGNSSSDYFSIETGPSSGLVSNEIVAIFSGPADYGLAYTTTNRNELFDGQWHHVAIVIDTSTKIYIDGVSKTVTVFNGVDLGRFTSHGSLDTFRIGNARINSSETNFFGGSLDEVRVYNRAIGPTEVAILAGTPPGGGGAIRTGVSSKTLTNGSTLGASGGLVGHWTFDGSDFGTAVIDGSGNGRNGFVQGAATSTVKAKGKLGQGVNFNESGYVITVPDNAGLNFGSAQDFSVSFYAQARVIAGVYAGMVGDKLSRATNRIGYLVAYENGGVDVYISDGVDEVNVFSSANAISDGAWHHIVLTASRTGNASLYIDGVSVGTPASMAAVGNIDDSGSPVLIGDIGFGGQPFDGVIDDVRIYNKVLTLSEIQQLSRLGQASVKP